MSEYEASLRKSFLKSLKALKKKPKLKERLDQKVFEILTNPHHYKPLRSALKNRRRVHIGVLF